MQRTPILGYLEDIRANGGCQGRRPVKRLTAVYISGRDGVAVAPPRPAPPWLVNRYTVSAR